MEGRDGACDIVSTNPERLCVNISQLSNTNLCLLADFAAHVPLFWVAMADVMQDVSSTTLVTREHKIGWEKHKWMP